MQNLLLTPCAGGIAFVSRSIRIFVTVACVSIIAPSAVAFDAEHFRSGAESSTRFVSEDHSVCIRNDFDGGCLDQCVEIGTDQFDLMIKPERQPINDSAWYAFQISATKPKTVQLRLHYVGGTHRYRPLTSYDKKTWRPLGERFIKVHPRKTEAVITLAIGPRPLWVSAQELITSDVVSEWSESLAKKRFVTVSEIGRSVQGRPIHKLEITESDSPSYIFIMARQHPPEVSGAIGMMRFVEAIASESKIAKRFRKSFCAVVIPSSNPDGVAGGLWRCNANGFDLNRDWGTFSQPETRAIGNEILSYRSMGRDSLYLLLDFHSTYEDVFYTAANVDEAFPKGFTLKWLRAIQERFPDDKVNHDATHNGNRTTSKAWAHRTLDVAAVTYEFADNRDRDQIKKLARGSADEMMSLLLQTQTAENQPMALIGVQSLR